MTFIQASNEFLKIAYAKCDEFLKCELTMKEINEKLPYKDEDIMKIFVYLNRSKCFDGFFSKGAETTFSITLCASGIDRIDPEINL